MKLPILYKAAKKGDNVQWSIETRGDSYIETYGRVGGKMQTNTHRCEPKNVGRANEKSAEQQAEFEAKAKWQSKLDKGYRERRDEIEDVPILPMLASKFEDRKGKFTYPVFTQPKLDGLRCIGKPDGTLVSRGGKQWDVPHISRQIRALKLKYPVDGELYIHGVSLQNITSYAKKNHGDGTTEKLNLVVYDMITPDKYPIRLRHIRESGLEEFMTDMTGQIAFLQTDVAHTEQEVYEAEKRYCQLGFEGAIVRTNDLMYENNHRSNNLMKVKSFQDAEFEVIGFREAQNGKVIWTCSINDRLTFDCYHKCTLGQGRWYYQNGYKFVRKKLTVKFFAYTPDGNLQFPIGIAFRDSRDLPTI